MLASRSPKTVTSLNSRLDRISAAIDRFETAASFVSKDLYSFVSDLKIINKRGELVSLIMNRSQEIIFGKILECRQERKPARFIILKARQMGVSTLIEAIIFALTCFNANRFGLVVAQSLEAAESIFGMTQRFYMNLPRAARMSPARMNARRLEFAPPHYSTLRVDTAGNEALGRGATFHYVHASEVAFWEKPEIPALAINQAVPSVWDSLVVWESTANGMNNLFHSTWMAAERNETDFVPIFLPWKEFPEYSLPVGDNEVPDLSEEERDYAVEAGLDRSQMKWAVSTRRNLCQNSWDKFNQEYPALARLAFISTGTPWFNQRIISESLEAAGEPLATGRLEYSGNATAPCRFVNEAPGILKIYRPPQTNLSYCLGMDVGEGVGADYTVIVVLCDESGEMVAMLRSNRIRPDWAATQAWLLGSYYNNGFLGIERNGPGLAALSVCERGLADQAWMRTYPNLYYHARTDLRFPSETERLGFITTRESKIEILSRLSEAFENRTVTISVKTALLEMQGFVWDSERRNFRQNYRSPGDRITHDDIIMALAIANEMRSRKFENRFIPRHFRMNRGDALFS